jgi:hypothetical protein
MDMNNGNLLHLFLLRLIQMGCLEIGLGEVMAGKILVFINLII